MNENLLPWMRGTLDGFLTVLSPRIIIRWNISHFQTNCRDSDHSFHFWFPDQSKQYKLKKTVAILNKSHIEKTKTKLKIMMIDDHGLTFSWNSGIAQKMSRTWELQHRPWNCTSSSTKKKKEAACPRTTVTCLWTETQKTLNAAQNPQHPQWLKKT